ncbi:MAG: thioredoxin [Bacteroidales bacterium]|nr:thioredoxin [Bacteroidales bacterium]
MNYLIWIILALTIIYLIYSTYKRYKHFKNYDPSSESNEIVTLTDANFDKTIAKGVFLVDFWAAWCAPCRMLAPVVSELAEEFKGKVKVGKLDVEANKKIASQFNIRSIPTLIVFKDGKPVKQLVGMKTKAALSKAVLEQL